MLEALVEELTGFHAWALSGEALIAAVDEGMRFRNQFDAFLPELVHQAELQGVAATQGATGTAVWLRDRYRVCGRDAGQWVKLASWLQGEGAATEAALASGDLNTAQARVIKKAIED